MSARIRVAALSLVAALFVVSLAAPAHANRQLAKAKAFAKRNALPTRNVKTGPTGRKVTRVFVPVLPAQFDEFTADMTTGSDGVLVRYTESNRHTAMALQPGDNYLWARNYNGQPGAKGPARQDYRGMYFSHNGRGYLIAAEVSDVGHLRSWLADRSDPADKVFCNGNCMEWLPNAEVAPGQAGQPAVTFFHDLGIKRSKDGPNMKAKMLHAANKRIAVVGVTVNSLAEFEAMTDDELLGAPPAAGVDDAKK